MSLRVPQAYDPEQEIGQSAFNKDVLRAFQQLREVPIINGALLENVAFDKTETVIKHRLGRVPRGVIFMNVKEQISIWHTRPADATNIYIISDNTPSTTISIWVF